MSSDPREAAAAALWRDLNQTRADGSRVFTKEQVDHCLPLLLLSSGTPMQALPPPLLALMQRFFAELGNDASANSETLAQAVERYYQSHPIADEILALVRRAYGNSPLVAAGAPSGWQALSGAPKSTPVAERKPGALMSFLANNRKP